jgi:hypothetical protein
MKHLIKKFTYAGAKKGGSKPPPPKPPVLKPPRVGSYKIGASYQFSEAVDLICHGPIDGLCNKFGSRLDNSQLLQGVYLNDVPVEQSLSSEKIRVGSRSFEGTGGESDIIEKFKYIGVVISDNNRNIRLQPAYRTSLSVVVSISTGKYKTKTYAPFTWKENILNKSGFSWSTSKPISYWFAGTLVNRYKGGTQSKKAFPAQHYGDQRFTAPTNGSFKGLGWPKMSNSKFFQSSSPYKAINAGTITASLRHEFCPTWALIDQEIFRGYNYLYKEGTCSPEAYDDSTCSVGYQEGGSYKRDVSIARHGINQLSNIYSNRNQNPYEWEYLRAKLKAYGFGNTQFIQDTFISEFKQRFGGRASNDEVSFKNAGSVDNLAKPYMAFQYQSTYVLEGFNQGDDQWTFINEVPALTIEERVRKRDIDFVLKDYPGSFPWYLRDINTVNMLIPVLDEDTGTWNGKTKGFYLTFINAESKQRKGVAYAQPINGNTTCGPEGTLKAFGMANSDVNFYRNIESLGIFKMPRTTEGLAGKYNYTNILAEYRAGDSAEKQQPLSYFKDVHLDRDISKRLLGPFNTDPSRRMQSLQNFRSDGIYLTSNGNPRQRSLIVSEKNATSNGNGVNVGYSDTRDNVVGVPAKDTIPAMRVNVDSGEQDWLLALDEGSSDARPSVVKELGYKTFEFSSWNNFKQDYNEKAQPITHVIYNPDAESCYITLTIEGLWDTLHVDQVSWANSKEVGTKMPGIVNFRVEVGYISPQSNSDKGRFVKSYDRFFRVISLIEGGAGVDIGNPDNAGESDKINYVKELYKDSSSSSESEYTGSLVEPFELPTARFDNSYGYEEIYRERYIRVTKLSTEGNSTLIQKVANLAKVTEIVPRTLNYPLSALVGTKVDARTFGEIPKRSYDCRLKKVKIPTNYFPLNPGGTDKRFWESAEDLEEAGKTDETKVYDGDWDGTFRYGWTDNPVWILYDMLTDPVIGLGDVLEESNINKWQLYKIGRWCDAVDANGYFVGVTDNILQGSNYSNGLFRTIKQAGGRQPRYSCNTIFDRSIKIYDALSLVSSNFRGLMYFTDSVVSFSDDRIKEPVMTFTNANVVEGIFNYQSFLKDEQYNAIEVAYNDKDDNYEAKIEYIENENDIRERGIVKTRQDAFGVTSRAQARRFGEHALYQATEENESVSFSTGLEGILVRPGDLIIIEDELKTLTSNFGRVLNVDTNENTIRITDIYDKSNFEGYLTVYIPTGSQQVRDIEDVLLLDRNRYDSFELFDKNGSALGNLNLTGEFSFDSYQSGFRDKIQNGEDIPGGRDQYPYYTGEGRYMWYSIEFTGWVLSTGNESVSPMNRKWVHNNTYDKIITPTSADMLDEEGNGYWHDDIEIYDSAELDIKWKVFNVNQPEGRNSTNFTMAENFVNLSNNYNGAVVDADVRINETKQIQNIKILSGQNLDENSIGAKLFVDMNDDNSIYLPLIPQGSVYRFKNKNTTDRVYKVSTINEDDTHSYEVIASLYKSGKFRTIEETNFRDVDTYIEPYESLYSIDEGSQESKYFPLPSPGNVSWVARNIQQLGGTLTVTLQGRWNRVKGATGYRVGIRSSFDTSFDFYDTVETFYDIENVNINGQYRMSVQALGAVWDNENFYTHYLDSPLVYKTVDIDQFEEAVLTDGAAIDFVIIN